MIEVTRINGTKITINGEMVEFVEETPDTVITMSTGTKLIVSESAKEITDLIATYKRSIYGKGVTVISQEG